MNSKPMDVEDKGKKRHFLYTATEVTFTVGCTEPTVIVSLLICGFNRQVHGLNR
jgi:hypothetical protein